MGTGDHKIKVYNGDCQFLVEYPNTAELARGQHIKPSNIPGNVVSIVRFDASEMCYFDKDGRALPPAGSQDEYCENLPFDVETYCRIFSNNEVKARTMTREALSAYAEEQRLEYEKRQEEERLARREMRKRKRGEKMRPEDAEVAKKEMARLRRGGVTGIDRDEIVGLYDKLQISNPSKAEELKGKFDEHPEDVLVIADAFEAVLRKEDVRNDFNEYVTKLERLDNISSGNNAKDWREKFEKAFSSSSVDELWDEYIFPLHKLVQEENDIQKEIIRRNFNEYVAQLDMLGKSDVAKRWREELERDFPTVFADQLYQKYILDLYNEVKQENETRKSKMGRINEFLTQIERVGARGVAHHYRRKFSKVAFSSVKLDQFATEIEGVAEKVLRYSALLDQIESARVMGKSFTDRLREDFERDINMLDGIDQLEEFVKMIPKLNEQLARIEGSGAIALANFLRSEEGVYELTSAEINKHLTRLKETVGRTERIDALLKRIDNGGTKVEAGRLRDGFSEIIWAEVQLDDIITGLEEVVNLQAADRSSTQPLQEVLTILTEAEERKRERQNFPQIEIPDIKDPDFMSKAIASRDRFAREVETLWRQKGKIDKGKTAKDIIASFEIVCKFDLEGQVSNRIKTAHLKTFRTWALSKNTREHVYLSNY